MSLNLRLASRPSFSSAALLLGALDADAEADGADEAAESDGVGLSLVVHPESAPAKTVLTARTDNALRNFMVYSSSLLLRFIYKN
ncbi:hypothetical protein D3C85_1280170 [compost metagenome]